MAKIQRIWAREILDSKSIPTIESACQLDTGHIAVSSIPSGTSTGSYEALELRDNDPSRYLGHGVLRAVENVNQILGPAVIGMDPTDQEGIDTKLIQLDGTENKSKYGANAILSISEVVAKSGAIASQTSLYKWINALAVKKGIKNPMRLPTPLFNMLNGGLHGAGNLDFQEFWVIPASSKGYIDSLRMGVEIYLTIGENLKHRGAIHSVGDEGGYAPNLFTNADALEILVESVKQTQYQMGRDVFLGLDIAASTFYKDGNYSIRDKSAPMNEQTIIEYYKELNSSYHLAFMEDALHEDAWSGWKGLTAALGDQLTIVGDDLLATNPKRVQKAINEKASNGVLVKPNQIGTITETLNVIKMARDANWRVIISHRSGETNDWFIADFAVGVGADYVKFGAPARGERVAKYNRLSSVALEIGTSQ
ncbi:phosphopyruvate hydratase [Candidatus Microgenomates bacterium]|nr:phosphopyruvate hydratase [Candidatus Microgenomates bacterium]